MLEYDTASAGVRIKTFLLHPVVGGSLPVVAMVGDLLWLCGFIPHPALVGVRQ
jgi:hypothetical protein